MEQTKVCCFLSVWAKPEPHSMLESVLASSNEQKLSQWSSALYGRSSFSSGIPFYLILLTPKAFDSFNNDFCNWLFSFFFSWVFGNVLPQLITSIERKSYNKNFKVILSFYTKWKFLIPSFVPFCENRVLHHNLAAKYLLFWHIC